MMEAVNVAEGVLTPKTESENGTAGENDSGGEDWCNPLDKINEVDQDLQDNKISEVDQDLQDQDEELRALGISVVDQLSLERDVEAAVDKAVTVHARKQRLQMLKKELQDVKKEMKQGDMKLSILSERLSAMRRRVVDPRLYMNVEKDFKSKEEQLKTLRNREEYLRNKLSAAETNEEELDDFELEEGEILAEDDDKEDLQSQQHMSCEDKEKLIREGQMTPFGTVMTSGASKTVSVVRPSHSKWEKGQTVSPKRTAIKGGPSKEDMISAGEMTPFGSVIKATTKEISKERVKENSASVMTDFEKYLQDQIDRQKQHSKNNIGVKRKQSTGDPNYGIQKRKKKPKEYIGNVDNDLDSKYASDDGTSLSSIKKKVKAKFESTVKNDEPKGKSSKKKSPIKMNVLHPKTKRHRKQNLGSITSELEADLYKETPRRILSERVSLEESDSAYSESESGSEYMPSDSDLKDIDLDVRDNMDDNVSAEKTDIIKENIDRPKRKRKKKIKSEDEWSCDEMPKIKGRRSMKEIDDGNVDDYVRRIETWKEEKLKKKHAKILRGEDLDSEEEEEQGYEEFDGGYKVPLSIWNKLYKYQRTCVKWLWELHCQGCGGILGDEMGLGKTIQIISFLVGLSYSRLSERRQRWKGLGPVLIVCPATVLHQWVKEFHKWWPPFRVAVLHESGSFVGKRTALIHSINKYDGILITSYTGASSQIEALLQYQWHYIILDEGHKIRNPDAQITVALKRFQTPHRLILSGSPIQNSLKELWSLFDFVFPGKLGTLPVFLSEFAVPITQGGYANASKLEVQTAFKCASVLRDTINPYLLRRMKNDVRNHLSLPDKNEQVLFCSLTEEQRSAYQEYLHGDQVKWIIGGRMKVFVGLINLRKICNHPDLYTGGPSNFDGYESGLQPELKYGWWGRSGKMHVLQAILRLWSKQGHRVLLFTQSRQMMCILEKFLMDEKYSYLKMDGTTSVSSRQPLIEKFNRDPSYFVFLLTTRVGGLGVNLTGADRVVIFDPDWNPSTDSQARERAWRIGQLRHVTIYRLLTSGTIEEKIYHRQIFKQFLTNRVLKDPKQQRFFKTNDLYELFTFNEGYKEKTESSAIFAGTDSEIKVNVDKTAKDSDECSDPKRIREMCTSASSKQKSEPGADKKQPRNKNTDKEKQSEKVKNSRLDQPKSDHAPKIDLKRLERMKALAKQISQNIGKKSNNEDSSVSNKQSSYVAKEVPCHNEVSHDPAFCNDEDKVLNDDHINESADENQNNCSKNEESPNKCELVIPTETLEKEVRSEEERLACRNIQSQPSNDIKEEMCIEETDLPESKVDIKEELICEIEDTYVENTNMKEEMACNENDSLLDSTINDSISSHSCHNALEELKESVNTDRSSSSEKHGKKKKKEKHKEKHREKEKKKGHRDKEERSHRKGKKLDGERIDYLVKKRNYRKTEEEEAAEKESAKSQDEYVLSKLFQKSGVHTALSHDSILNNSDPDYLLMEGEAERVAKEALKAVRASRARCFRPWSSSEKTVEPKKNKPKFGNKKNKIFTDSIDREIKVDKDGKNCEKKKQMFNGGMQDDSDGETEETFSPMKKRGKGVLGGMSSAQLLSCIRQRNKTVGSLELDNDGSEDEYDPEYPSTAASAVDEEIDPDIQENIDLLTDIRNFVAFQAEVDGSASTQEIINRFKSRLPPEQTPFFKALLTQICDFHRKPSGEGIWSLKGEFR